MNKYAVIAVGTKQYTVEVGDVLEVQKMPGAQGSIVFDQVLLVSDGDKVEVGTPTVAGLTVTGIYLEDKKGDKVQVFKYKSKSKYRKLRGARQIYSYIKIEAIGLPEKSSATTKNANPAKVAAPKVKKATKSKAKVAKVSQVKPAVRSGKKAITK